MDIESTEAALACSRVDAIGLDLTRPCAVLKADPGSFGGGPVGLSTLAVAVRGESETVETVCEPFLLRSGLPGPGTPRSRIATARNMRAPGLGTSGWSRSTDPDQSTGCRTPAVGSGSGTRGVGVAVGAAVRFVVHHDPSAATAATGGAGRPDGGARGAEVMTTAGIYGTVVWMEDQTIGLQISDGVVVKYARAAVASVMDGEG